MHCKVAELLYSWDDFWNISIYLEQYMFLTSSYRLVSKVQRQLMKTLRNLKYECGGKNSQLEILIQLLPSNQMSQAILFSFLNVTFHCHSTVIIFPISSGSKISKLDILIYDYVKILEKLISIFWICVGGGNKLRSFPRIRNSLNEKILEWFLVDSKISRTCIIVTL